MFHSISAFCNAGFDLIGIRTPFSSLTSYSVQPIVNLVIMMLIIAAMTPEACVEEAFDNLGKSLSVIAGEHNKANVHNWQANKTDDEYIRYMGSFYSNN